MLYDKAKSKAWRVPFTRCVLLRSPCEVNPVELDATVGVVTVDARTIYRLESKATIEKEITGKLHVVSVVRLQDILRKVYEATQAQTNKIEKE